MDNEDTIERPASAGFIFDRYGQMINYLMLFVLSTLVIIISAEVILRAIVGGSFGFVEEITAYLVVTLTFFGASLAIRKNSLFRVIFIFKTLPLKLIKILNFLFLIFALSICLLLAWKSFQLVGSSFERGKFAPTVLKTPLWIPQAIMSLGFFTMGIFIIEQFLLSLNNKDKD